MTGKRFLTMVICGILCVLLGGCGLSTEAVVDKMLEAELESCAIDGDYGFAMVVKGSGVSIELDISGELAMDYQMPDDNKLNLYVWTEAELKSFYMSEKTTLEAYYLKSRDDVDIYSREENDDWEHKETESDIKFGALLADSKEILRDILLEAELQQGTEKVGRDECYVLKLDTTLDTYEDLLNRIRKADRDGFDEAIDDMMNMDWKDFKSLLPLVDVELSLYVAKETGHCRRVILDFSNTDLETFLNKVAELLDEDIEDMVDMLGIGVDEMYLDELMLDMEIRDINMTSVRVPKTVRDEAIEVQNYWQNGMTYDYEDVFELLEDLYY